MGQAKARGSKDQRVTEAVERARVSEIARREQARADRMARAEALEAKQAEQDKENAERLARGDKPLPERVQLGRGRTQSLSTLLAVVGIAMLASR
jgi:hypothetical protein